MKCTPQNLSSKPKMEYPFAFKYWCDGVGRLRSPKEISRHAVQKSVHIRGEHLVGLPDVYFQRQFCRSLRPCRAEPSPDWYLRPCSLPATTSRSAPELLQPLVVRVWSSSREIESLLMQFEFRAAAIIFNRDIVPAAEH